MTILKPVASSRLPHAMREADAVFVPQSVMLELEWVLRGFLEFARADIGRVFDHLFGLPSVLVDRAIVAIEALRYYYTGLDFADALHAASSSEAEALLTFDRRLASRARRIGVRPTLSAVG